MVQKSHQELIDKINNKIDLIENMFNQINALKKELIAIEKELFELDGLTDSIEDEQRLAKLRDQASNIGQQIKLIIQQGKKLNSEDINELKLIHQKVDDLIIEKEKEFARGKELRMEYVNGVEALMSWIEKSKVIIEESKSNIPKVAKEKIIDLAKEVNPMKEHLNSLNKTKSILSDHTCGQEKELVESTLKGLSLEINGIEKRVLERCEEIEKSLKAWDQFNKLKTSIEKWIVKVTPLFTHDPNAELTQKTLPEIRKRLDELKEYDAQTSDEGQLIPRGCLVEMNQCLSKITFSGCSLGNLSSDYDDIEHKVSLTDLKLQQEIAYMSELIEEWEQFDYKLSQIETWMSMCQKQLNDPSVQSTLKDQLCAKEVNSVIRLN